MSTRRRRSRKCSKRLDMLKVIRRAKIRKSSQKFKIGSLRFKGLRHPSGYKVLKVPKEGEWKELRPLVDVFDDNDEVIVVAAFTGYKVEHIKVHVRNQRLTLCAQDIDHKSYKSINLPRKVIPETLRKTYKNGVLEVKLKKAAEEKTIDRMTG